MLGKLIIITLALFIGYQAQAALTTDECGTTKGCFFSANNCKITSEECYFISWKRVDNGTKYEFEISGGNGNGNQYVAFAFGTLDRMQDADVYYCDGEATYSAVITTLGTEPTYLNFTEEPELSQISASTTGGVGQCVMRRGNSVTKNITNGPYDFDLDTNNYYLLVAKGLTKNNGIFPHTWKTLSDAKVNFSAIDVVLMPPETTNAPMEPTTAPVTTQTPACDTLFNCFSDPEGCNKEDADCRYISWKKSDSNYDFTMGGGTGNGAEYIAFALGTMYAMQDADLYYCDGMQVRSGAIQKLHSEPEYLNMTNGLVSKSATTVNGKAECVLTRPASVTKTLSSGSKKDYDITKERFYLLTAVGDMSATEGQITYHDWRTLDSTTHDFSGSMSATPITVDGCDETKSCYRDPEGCDLGSPDCHFISWRQDDEGNFIFEMSGGAGGGTDYFAFALGTQNAMQDADLYYCDGFVIRSGVIQTLHNPPAYLAMKDGLVTMMASTMNGVSQCILGRPSAVTKTISNNVDKKFDLSSESYYLLLATGKTNGSQIQKHTYKNISDSKIDFSSSSRLIVNSWMLTITAWITLMITRPMETKF